MFVFSLSYLLFFFRLLYSDCDSKREYWFNHNTNEGQYDVPDCVKKQKNEIQNGSDTNSVLTSTNSQQRMQVLYVHMYHTCIVLSRRNMIWFQFRKCYFNFYVYFYVLIYLSVHLIIYYYLFSLFTFSFIFMFIFPVYGSPQIFKNEITETWRLDSIYYWSRQNILLQWDKRWFSVGTTNYWER